jgi:hypothetical protein
MVLVKLQSLDESLTRRKEEDERKLGVKMNDETCGCSGRYGPTRSTKATQLEGKERPNFHFWWQASHFLKDLIP